MNIINLDKFQEIWFTIKQNKLRTFFTALECFGEFLCSLFYWVPAMDCETAWLAILVAMQPTPCSYGHSQLQCPMQDLKEEEGLIFTMKM